MDLLGLCSNCGKPGTMISCRLCGRLFCINCIDIQHSSCKDCIMGKK